MVSLSPRFTFLATFCALAALSSAPISDAAVLGLRSSDSALANMASGDPHAGAATWFTRHSSHVVDKPPVLPLPRSHGEFSDLGNSPSSSSGKDGQKISSADGSHGEKNVFAGDGNKGSPYDNNGEVPNEGEIFKVRISNLIVHHSRPYSFE
jgi:hypothetical protein